MQKIMALRSDQLNKILNATLHRTHYWGAVSFEDLPLSIKNFPFCVVINSSPKDNFYGHWTCLFAENKHSGVYFDSFGLSPWGRIHDLIIRNLKNVIFNKRLLQNPESEACGYYCILMLKNLDARISLAEAMSQFSDDVIENDKKVISQIRRLISVLKV